MKTSKPGMHKRYLLAFAAVVGMAMGLNSCAMVKAPVVPPPGFIYADIKAPLSYDFSGQPAGPALKKATRSKVNYLWLYWVSFAWDNAAVEDIARDGGIETISYADYEIYNILGIYSRATVNVYGN